MKLNLDNIFSAGFSRTHKTWVSVIEYFARELSSATSSNVEIGAYWVSDKSDEGSFCSRMKSNTPLPGTQSDCWEASVCLSFDKETFWVDAELFLFKDGKVLSKHGFVDEHKDRAGEFYRYYWEDNTWKILGWSFSDGSGEWEWIDEPGVCYFAEDIKPVSEKFK